jgi:hypothetical protein
LDADGKLDSFFHVLDCSIYIVKVIDVCPSVQGSSSINSIGEFDSYGFFTGDHGRVFAAFFVGAALATNLDL